MASIQDMFQYYCSQKTDHKPQTEELLTDGNYSAWVACDSIFIFFLLNFLSPMFYKLKLALIGTLLLSSMYACKEDSSMGSLEDSTVPQSSFDAHLAFGEILAKAAEDKDVRAFIKSEATKQFDKDYDILVHAVKDRPIKNGATFYDLLKAADTHQRLDQILNTTPLLTIFVPNLPSFSVNSWNTDTDELPLVAVSGTKEDKTITYLDGNGNQEQIESNLLPDFPVLVVKNNERVQAGASGKGARIASSSALTFSFIDDAYNPAVKQASSGLRLVPGSNADPKVVQAYEKSLICANCYQRDYVYYSIDPSAGVQEGSVDLRYSEAVTSLTFHTKAGIEIVSGNFTEGNLELHFQAFFVGASEQLNKIEKVISLPVSAFYSTGSGSGSGNADAEKKCQGNPIQRLICLSKIKKSPESSTTLVEYVFPEPLLIAPWEMDKYGNRWLLKMYEYDPATKYKSIVGMETTKAQNYKVSADGTYKVVKVGAEFGGSTTTVSRASTEVEYTLESNQLGEIIVSWTDPIFARKEIINGVPNFAPLNYSTGTVQVNLETVKILR